MTPLTPATNAYLRDLLDQPAALRNTLAGLSGLAPLAPLAERLASGQLRRVVLTGMGSSYQALHPLHYTLLDRGLTALMLETSELVHYARALLDAGTLVVAISQSGQSAEIVQLLIRRGPSALIGVTNSPEGALARQADVALLTRAGAEHTVSCKTYVASLAMLAVLGDLLTGRNPAATLAGLAQTVSLMAAYLDGWNSHVAALNRLLQGTAHLILAGRGPSLAAAGAGGLIIKEAAHFPAEGMSAAGFRHGPLEMISPGLFLIVYAGDERTAPLNASLVADVQAAGGRAALIAGSGPESSFILPAGPAAGFPLLEILPAQMLSLALAGLQGHEAGRFVRATKVTAVE